MQPENIMSIWPSTRDAAARHRALTVALTALPRIEDRLCRRLSAAEGWDGPAAPQAGDAQVREIYAAVVNSTAAADHWRRGHAQRRMRAKQRATLDAMLRNANRVAALLGARLTPSRYSTEEFIRASGRNRRLLFGAFDAVNKAARAWTEWIDADTAAAAAGEQADLLPAA